MKLKKCLIIGATVLALAPTVSMTAFSGVAYADETVTEVSSDTQVTSVLIQKDETITVEELIGVEEEPQISTRAVTHWKLFNRKYYRLSNIKSAQSITVFILGLFPIGKVAGGVLKAGSVWNSVKGTTSKEVYVKLEQFKDKTNRKVKNIVYYYRDAKYTKKITQAEFIYRF
ncbi:hypothetical protein AAK938_01200 [Aerococcaceae bacterium 50-4]